MAKLNNAKQNAEFDYPNAVAREFFVHEAGEFDESKVIRSKTLADLFKGFDEKENKHQKG